MVTSSSSGTVFNTLATLVDQTNFHHKAYIANGGVYAMRRPADGSGWTTPIRLDDGSTTVANVGLSVDGRDNLQATWEEPLNASRDRLAVSADTGTTWNLLPD
jgi:hypothetical protein